MKKQSLLLMPLLFLSSINILAHADEPIIFNSELINDDIKNTMYYSWSNDNPVPLKDLRFLTISHWGYDNTIHIGHMIVHAIIAQEVLEIFKQLLEHRFPIEQIKLIDTYQANDILSMQANNSSAFCSRRNTTKPDQFSKHSYGLAIDINPKYNPYIREELVLPPGSKKYVSRKQKNIPGFITNDSMCFKIFSQYGWLWGGNFEGRKDYHHFEKDLKIIENYK